MGKSNDVLLALHSDRKHTQIQLPIMLVIFIGSFWTVLVKLRLFLFC